MLFCIPDEYKLFYATRGISIEIGISHAYNAIDIRFPVKTGLDSCTNVHTR